EHLRLTEAQGSEGFEIVNVEYLGNEVYVYLEPKQGETLLIQRGEAPTRWSVGQRVALAPDPEHVHLFDTSNRALPLKAARAVA
ncbi:MAG: TOBE domain-containing protein, partial [Halomonas sp.]|nr:TOBE domain-containing protein [Halomonas sp.]